MKHTTAAAILAILLTACAGSMEFGSPMDISYGAGKRIHEYTQQATHLTPEQKQAMIQRSPFVGMTLEEADLSMYRERVNTYASGRTVQVVYTGGWGRKYYLYFEGDPPTVRDYQGLD